MDKNVFFETYAPLAIEQQQKFGIPASVTLAQMALESGYGKGRAIREGNNAFCVKGEYNGHYILISDDKPNEKFKVYPSLRASFEDHSRVLMGKNYAHCRGLDSSDYLGWCYGLQSGASTGARYATDPRYSNRLIGIIESNDLAKYDKICLSSVKRANVREAKERSRGRYAMPLGGDSLVITSDIGHRNTGIEGASTNHNGIDLRANHAVIYATEPGKVIAVDNVGNSKSGKYVMVQHERDGHKYTVSYCHLSQVDLKVGDSVNGGDKLGVSGNSSYRDFAGKTPLAPHLHLTVRKDGSYYDPKKYLAEVAVLGGIDIAVKKKNESENVLLAYKDSYRNSTEYRNHREQSITASDRLDVAQNEQKQDSSKDDLQEQMDFNDQQRANMEKANCLAALTGSGDSKDWFSWLIENKDDISDGGDLVACLAGQMMMGAITLAMAAFGMGVASSDGEQAGDDLGLDMTVSEDVDASVYRDRSSVVSNARSQAGLAFDASYPERQLTQSQGLRM